MMKPILLLMITALLFCSCGNKLPEGVIQPAIMKNMMWDMMVAEQVQKMDTSKESRQHIKDSTTAAFNKILSIYNISEERYKKSLQYYETHPDELKNIFDSLSNYGKRLSDSLKPADKKNLKKKLLSDDSLHVSPKLDSNKLHSKLPEKHFIKPENKTLKSL